MPVVTNQSHDEFRNFGRFVFGPRIYMFRNDIFMECDVTMGILERIHAAFSGERICPPEHLAAYRRLGEQVFELEVELSNTQEPVVLALVRATKVFQTMADALLKDAYDDQLVPVVTHEQAEEWYGMIPDLMVAARQENLVDGGSTVRLPIRLGKKTEANHRCPVSHLAGMRRAADDVERLLAPILERARLETDKYKSALLRYEEARTRRQVGDAIVGAISHGQHVPEESHEEAEEQYWATLSAYLLTAQGLAYPDCLNGQPLGRDSASKLDSDDVWRITSETAKREIRNAGEWWQAERDLAELWESHRITGIEREYEITVEDLVHQHKVREDGYWACCPFQPVYKVVFGPVGVVGHNIPTGHVFVWDYGEDGEPGRFITQQSFTHADSRQYCGDED